MCIWFFFFFQAEDGIRDLVRSRGLGDVYKRQDPALVGAAERRGEDGLHRHVGGCGPVHDAGDLGLSLIHI